jgi:hypothetical protein
MIAMNTTAALGVGVFSWLLTTSALQPAVKARPLPVVHIQACRLRESPLMQSARWGGTIAEYTAMVDAEGKVGDLKLIPGRRNLLHAVQVDDFTSCLAQWRLGTRGVHTIKWTGGRTVRGEIEVTPDNASFTLGIQIVAS